MSIWPPVPTLDHQRVRLTLLSQDYAEDLACASAEAGLYKLWYTSVPHPDDMEIEITRRLSLRKSGSMLPFAVIDREHDRAVGMTTYMNIDADNRRLEIGSTWYARSAQRTHINTICKILLLTNAFETLQCIAVEFRTHVMNRDSCRAIERLGAKFDGILRAHMVMPNGTIRDTAVYSITAPEWPAVKANLAWQLEKPIG